MYSTEPRGRRARLPLHCLVPILTGVILLAAVGLGAGCGKEHRTEAPTSPIDPNVSGITPPIPIGVEATVESRSVNLDWILPDSTHVSDIKKYRIYRRTPEQALTLADSSAAPPVRVRGLVNGTPYRFSVTTVLKNGLEGLRSDEVTVVPALYGVQIASGAERVNSVDVRLAFLAPSGTEGIQIANENDFSSVPTTAYASTLNWRLSPGDGEKTVSARFTDADGNVSSPVQDTVILDTKAEIAAVDFSPTEASPGEVVRFTLDAGERNGRAEVELGSGARRISLRDDGSNGDTVADDGVYTADYGVEDNLDLVDAVVTGSFTDEAGNQADSRIAEQRLTILREVPAVTLDPILAPSPGELLLTWSQVGDASRFSSYRVYRADAPGVDTSATRRLVTEISQRANTTYTDRDLDPERTYYYRIFVVDPHGSTSSSNEESARPRALAPVVLAAPVLAPDSLSVTLAWSGSDAPGFQDYRVYRDTAPAVGESSTLVRTVSDRDVTGIIDGDRQENTRYYYRVFVHDDQGNSAGSNELSVVTSNHPPRASTLSVSDTTDTSVSLSWTENTDHDFDEYRVYMSTDGVIFTESASFTHPEETTYTAFVGVEGGTFYFYIQTFDRPLRSGQPRLSKESNRLSVRIPAP